MNKIKQNLIKINKKLIISDRYHVDKDILPFFIINLINIIIFNIILS